MNVPDEETNKKDLAWAERVSGFIAEELIAGKLITRDQANFAAEIAAQQIHIFLISGYRPPNWPANSNGPGR